MQINLFVNRRYLFPALVTIMTAKNSLGTHANFGLGFFDGELGGSDLENVKRFCESIEVSIEMQAFSKSSSAILEGQNSEFHFGAEAFGKILYAAASPGRHVYSDVDVLFVGNLEPIWSELREIRGMGFVTQARALEDAGFEYKPHNREFFSGFILWPEESCRPTLDITEQLLDSTEFSIHDQAFLNRIVGSSFQPLMGELCQLDNPKLKADNVKTGIVHFWGNWKPWHAPEKARKRCEQTRCYWSLWFESEAKLAEHFPQPSQKKWIRELQSLAQKSTSRRFRALSCLVAISNSNHLTNLLVKVAHLLKLRGFHLIH